MRRGAAGSMVVTMFVLVLGACAGGDVPADTRPDSVALPPDDTVAVAPAGAPGSPDAGGQDCVVPSLEPRAGSRVVRVFFTCADSVRPVDRYVSDSPALLTGTLNALLAGPTDEELLAGFFSWFNRETAGMVASVEVRDSVADVSFGDFSSLIPGASSSAGSEQLLAQLRATIFQFPGLREARLSFDGDCDAFWNWLQRGCQALRPGSAPEEA